jgi:hypothetical protein
MNLFVYWEYMEWICTYTENTQNAQKVEYLGEFETKKLKIFWDVYQEPKWVHLAKQF